MRKHVDRCTVKTLQLSDIEILASTIRGIEHLLTLEALYVSEIKPELNRKDKYRSRELTIKFSLLLCLNTGMGILAISFYRVSLTS